MQALRKTLPALIAANDSHEMRRAVVFAMWPSVVGDHLKDRSMPMELKDDVLTVSVPDANWKREFEHHAPAIVYKLNKTVGRHVVKRIECKADRRDFHQLGNTATDQRPRDRPTVDPSVISAAAGIENSDLRNNFLAAVSRCLNRAR